MFFGLPQAQPLGANILTFISFFFVPLPPVFLLVLFLLPKNFFFLLHFIAQHQHFIELVSLSISNAQHQNCLALALLRISISIALHQHQHCLALALALALLSISIAQHCLALVLLSINIVQHLDLIALSGSVGLSSMFSLVHLNGSYHRMNIESMI